MSLSILAAGHAMQCAYHVCSALHCLLQTDGVKASTSAKHMPAKSFRVPCCCSTDGPDAPITQQLLDWLCELYSAVAAVDPRHDAVPCLAAAGWTAGATD
jgi:hypothetical protein